MKSSSPLVRCVLLATALLGLLLAGCTSQTEKDSSVPWNRPASWEGQIPGMGTGQ